MNYVSVASSIRILLVRLCVFAMVLGCDVQRDTAKVEDSQKKIETSAVQQRAENSTEITERPGVTHIGMTWSDGIYDEPLYENETRKFGIDVDIDCEQQELRARATFQSNEVEPLISHFKNSGANRCEAEIQMPLKIRPMWVQLEVVTGIEPELDSLSSICLYATLRDIAIMDVGDESLYSMDELASTRLGEKLINEKFVREGCTKNNYLNYYMNFGNRY